MTIKVDPENNEIRALFDLTDLEGRHVLEIGAGDARLTRRYAHKVSHVTAVEPFEEAVARARETLPDELASRIELHPVPFEEFAAAAEESTFDTAILSWSLCCMDPEVMVPALEEIHRLLRPGGTLIDIHPVPEVSLIEVFHRGEVVFAKPEPTSNTQEAQHADDALRQVVERDLFVLETATEFDFRVYASSVRDLQDFCAEASAHESATVDQVQNASESDFFDHVEDLRVAAGEGAEVAFYEKARIARLRPVR